MDLKKAAPYIVGVVCIILLASYFLFRGSTGSGIIKQIIDYGPLFTPPPAPPQVSQSSFPSVAPTPQEKAFDKYW
jgi:hypothetical protein